MINVIPLGPNNSKTIKTTRKIYQEDNESLSTIDVEYEILTTYCLQTFNSSALFTGEGDFIGFDEKWYTLTDGSLVFEPRSLGSPLPQKSQYDEKGILLGFHSRIYNNIGHFLTDQFPIFERAKVFWNLGYKTVVICQVRSELLKQRITEFFSEYVSFPFNLVFEGFVRHVCAEEMIIPQMVSRHPVAKSSLLKPLIDKNKEIYSRNTKKSLRRFYISRRDASDRKVSNEDELISSLDMFGFEEIVPSQLSARQSIEKLASAEIVIGALGAGMVHIMNCLPETKIVCLSPRLSGGDWFHNLSEIFELEYTHYAVSSNGAVEDFKRSSENFQVDVCKLCRFVESDLLPGG